MTSDSPIDERAIRALCETMTVTVEEDIDLATVDSSSGRSYTVDLRTGACECEDALYNLSEDARCKHALRARWATGRDPIPAELVDAVGENADPYLGRWTDSEVHVEGEDEIIEAGDDGEVIEA